MGHDDTTTTAMTTATTTKDLRQRTSQRRPGVRDPATASLSTGPIPIPQPTNQPTNQSMNQSTMNDDGDQPRSRPARTTMRTSAHHLTTLPGVPGMVGRCRAPVLRAHELRSGEGGEEDGSGKFCYLAGFTYE